MTGFLDLWHDERIDQTEELGFEIAADHPKAYTLAPDVELRWDGRRFYVDELEAGRRGTTATIIVRANALWYRLADVSRIGSVFLDNLTPLRGLTLLLAGTGWTPGPGTSDTVETFSLEEQDRSVLALLRSWARVTGRKLVWDTSARTVTLADNRGRDLGLAYRYGRNVTGVRRRLRPPTLTVLYPYGADGLTIAGVNGGLEFVEDFSYYTDQGLDLPTARALYTRSAPWYDERFLVEGNLLAAATERLARLSQGSTTYELDVVDLSALTDIAEGPQIGDHVRVTDPQFVTDLRTSIVRLRRHPLEPWRNRVELAGIPDPVGPSGSEGRPQSSQEWRMFVGPVAGDYQIRNDGTFTTNRIGLRFRDGGQANYHLDLHAVGVGDGTMLVEVLDSVTSEVQFRPLEIPYLDGQEVRAVLSWANFRLAGSHDYRVRVSTIADGGPDPTRGVNIAQDSTPESSWWILAQGAVQESPTSPNVERFEFNGDADGRNGTVRQFTVPDGVDLLTVDIAGAQGASAPGSLGGGRGGRLRFGLPVVPGTVFDIYVGGRHSGSSAAAFAGWPNGGAGGIYSSEGGGGGGATYFTTPGGTIAEAIAVAAGGGGSGATSGIGIQTKGGDGRFYIGEDGQDGSFGTLGGGATQFAGGATTGAGEAGDTDGQGFGGRALPSPGSGSLGVGAGGGGGGWRGGGGASGQQSAGGGGSGIVSGDAFDLEILDGSNTGNGFLEFRWDNPPD